MEDQEDEFECISDLPTNPNQPNISQLRSTSDQTDHYVLHIHCLDTKKTLKDKKYVSLEEFKREAFGLYEKGKFTDDNAILTYLNKKKEEVLLTSIRQLHEKNAANLFIRFVYTSSIDCYIKIISNLFIG
jgi:hypothetical protein